MVNFKFKYENLLNLVEKKENDIKNALSCAYNELHLEEEKLYILKKEEHNYFSILKDKSSNGCKLSTLKNIDDYIKNLHLKIKRQNDKIAEKKEKIQFIKNKLIEISKEKKIFEKLKEKKFEEYKTFLKLEEDKIIDQLVSYNNKSSRW